MSLSVKKIAAGINKLNIKSFQINEKDLSKSLIKLDDSVIPFSEIGPELTRYNAVRSGHSLGDAGQSKLVKEIKSKDDAVLAFQTSNDGISTITLKKDEDNSVNKIFYHELNLTADTVNKNGEIFSSVKKDNNGEVITLIEKKNGLYNYVIRKGVNDEIISTEYAPKPKHKDWLTYTVVQNKNGDIVQLREGYVLKPALKVE